MRSIIKIALGLTVVAVVGYGGYYYGANQSLNSVQTTVNPVSSESGDIHELGSVDLPEISLNTEQFETKLAELDAFNKDMRLRHREIEEQIESIQLNTVVEPDAELLSTEMLSKLSAPEDLLSSATNEGVSSFARSSGASTSALVNSVDPVVKLDVQTSTGISPNDIDSAFNVENIE